MDENETLPRTKSESDIHNDGQSGTSSQDRRCTISRTKSEVQNCGLRHLATATGNDDSGVYGEQREPGISVLMETKVESHPIDEERGESFSSGKHSPVPSHRGDI